MDRNLLTLTLAQTKNSQVLILEELAEGSSKPKVTKFLSDLTNHQIILQPTIDNNLHITREQRAQLALLGARQGIEFEKILTHLIWQEFEIITTIIGDEFGYHATTGLNFSTRDRKYQIDVILKNSPYVLLIDCKHYGGTGKKSVFQKAADDQIDRVEAVVKNYDELKMKINTKTWKKVILIPVIVTWFDDAVFFHSKVPVVPFSKLRSFFRDFYLYIEDIIQFKIE